jgi:hypothetical protein
MNARSTGLLLSKAVLPPDRLDNSGMPSLHKIISFMAALYALLLVYQLLRASFLQSATNAVAKLTSRRRQWRSRTPNDCP